VVGEVRGSETIDMLQAMNTGHDGSLVTVHANSADDAIYRLQTLATMGDGHGPYDAIRDQINSAVDAIEHLGRWPDGPRRVDEIAVSPPDDARSSVWTRFCSSTRCPSAPTGPWRASSGTSRCPGTSRAASITSGKPSPPCSASWQVNRPAPPPTRARERGTPVNWQFLADWHLLAVLSSEEH